MVDKKTTDKKLAEKKESMTKPAASSATKSAIRFGRF
jgi:hypothetical protein